MSATDWKLRGVRKLHKMRKNFLQLNVDSDTLLYHQTICLDQIYILKETAEKGQLLPVVNCIEMPEQDLTSVHSSLLQPGWFLSDFIGMIG